MNTVLLNQMIVIISQSFNECFSNDEQAIIGAFLTKNKFNTHPKFVPST